jgi:hypothetical protein
MPVREAPPRPAPSPSGDKLSYSAEKARGGDIILRTRWQRAIFIGGLVGAVVLVLLLRLLS